MAYRLLYRLSDNFNQLSNGYSSQTGLGGAIPMSTTISSLKSLDKFRDGNIVNLPSGHFVFDGIVEFSRQRKVHRKKRLNKKYLKRYGMIHYALNLVEDDISVGFNSSNPTINYSGAEPFISIGENHGRL